VTGVTAARAKDAAMMMITMVALVVGLAVMAGLVATSATTVVGSGTWLETVTLQGKAKVVAVAGSAMTNATIVARLATFRGIAQKQGKAKEVARIVVVTRSATIVAALGTCQETATLRERAKVVESAVVTMSVIIVVDSATSRGTAQSQGSQRAAVAMVTDAAVSIATVTKKTEVLDF
jgi:hypothetical protein